jgi:hypothetical protein
MRTRLPTILVAALAVSALLGACGDDGETGTATTTTAEVTTTSEATTTTSGDATTTSVDGIDPMDDAGTDPVSGTGTGTGAAALVDVRMSRHEGFDRIAFEFADGRLPGYLVQYVEPPIIEDASGNTVTIDGSFFIQIRMEPAAGFDSETGQVTYEGPTRISGADAGTFELVEAVRTGDFEAVLNWHLGVADRVDFRVLELTDPARLAVDVRNH